MRFSGKTAVVTGADSGIGRATAMRRTPLGIGSPEWVASAICYLASEDSRYTTGACLDVDGGYSMDGSLPGGAYS